MAGGPLVVLQLECPLHALLELVAPESEGGGVRSDEEDTFDLEEYKGTQMLTSHSSKFFTRAARQLNYVHVMRCAR